MYIYLSLLICVVGGIVYLIVNAPQNQKIAELGRVMFAMGLLAFLLQYVPHLLKLYG